jgi:hypothetical protein
VSVGFRRWRRQKAGQNGSGPAILRAPERQLLPLRPAGDGQGDLGARSAAEAVWIDLPEPETLCTYAARPERVRERLAAERGKRTVVIDEVQRAPGVFRAARPTGPVDARAELEGAALEGLVFQHLRAWIAYRGERSALAYWRTRNGREVDFVLHGPDGFVAIEVKNSRRVHPLDAQGLRAFREDHPEVPGVLLYRGRERVRFEGEVAVIPAQESLLGMDPSKSGLPGGAGE